MLFLLLSIKSHISSEGNTQNGAQSSLGYGRTDERTLEDGPNVHAQLDGNRN